jgi:hypothetical protein
MTLEIIVAEKTPLGNVTCRGDDWLAGYVSMYAIETDKVVQKPVRASTNCIHRQLKDIDTYHAPQVPMRGLQ